MENLQNFITDAQQLDQLIGELSGAEWLAVDTEFMREKTYYPKLCLIQLATPELAACVDVLALDDLGPLLDLLYDENILKVFHSAGQDLEMFYHMRGSVPQPLFDTQLAAPLLGYPEQMGYARLVEAVTGKHLPKIHTRADWAQRPLSQAEIEYALDDVIFLCDVYRDIHDRLQSRGRLDWLQADTSRLTETDQFENAPQLAWRKVKAANKLRGPALSVLQSLAEWREQHAQQVNRPRRWLIKDDVLVEMARRSPRNPNELKKIRGIAKECVEQYAAEIIDIIAQARQVAPQSADYQMDKARLDYQGLAVADILSAIVHIRADEQEINPSYLAPRKQIEALVAGNQDCLLLSGWRRDLIGEELLQLMQGGRSIRIDDGRIRLEQN